MTFQIYFRVDASKKIGSGHVMRCLSLADSLEQRGASCTFICRKYDGNMIDIIQSKGFKCFALPYASKELFSSNLNEEGTQHTDLFGINWNFDARETATILQDKKVDWLVIDHYSIDKRWERKLQKYADKIVVIDDLADRSHDCDVLIDQNLVASLKTRYDDLIPTACEALLGPKYALLNSEYSQFHANSLPRSGVVKKILVFFGAAADIDLVLRALKACLSFNCRNIEINVILGYQQHFDPRIQSLLDANQNIILHRNLPSLARLLFETDLAVGAAGGNSWERCCLGVPSLIVTIADNQVPIAKELHRLGLAKWLGKSENVSEDMLANEIRKAISSLEFPRISQACLLITDGKGVKRVSSALTLHSQTKLAVRFVRHADKELLLRWANDPMVRDNAFCPNNISQEIHQKWFYKRLNDSKNFRMYIIETDDELPIGQFRFESKDTHWEINYSLCSISRGKGLASKAMALALGQFWADFPNATVVGKVKNNNFASRKTFKKLGFSFTNNNEISIFMSVRNDKFEN